jgi:choline dehydrogenase-like flavoprotein
VLDNEAAAHIRYGYLDAHDVDRLVDGVELAFAMLGQSSSDEISASWLLSRLQTADHACGTCRLGLPDDPMSVVDERCRVIGTSGLRVVDLSIVPRSVRAGPYATAVMLAERASDLIREDLSAG